MGNGGEAGGPAAAPRRRSVTAAVLAAAIGVLTLAAFAPALRNGFVELDDRPTLLDNPRVRQGLTAEAVRWAFTSLEFENWHPLAWLSHALDFSLFGSRARGHHATSVLIHAANAVLLFRLLQAMTGALWRSALVAALFGVHPLRVESVAWVSERKDVLTVLFGLLALLAWVRHARRRGAAVPVAAVALYAAALMSKAMLMTLPAILLLLDYWPLGRLGRGSRGGLPPWRLLLEKAPFAALAAGTGAVAFLAQDRGGALGTVDRFPLAQQAGNALCSYLDYLGKSLWPAKLAVFYPYFWEDVPRWKPIAGAALVVGVAAAALRARRRRPALLVGWAWYLVALLPVIGLVQLGSHAMADRYTYFPQIGLLLLAAWGLAAPAPKPRAAAAAFPAAALALAALTAATWSQIGHWSSNTALFTHAMRVTEKNYVAWSVLGQELIEQGREAEGRELFARALALAPLAPEAAHEQRGDDFAAGGRPREAAEEYRKALEIAPGKRELREKLRALGAAADAPPKPPAPLPPGHAALDPLQRGNFLVRAGRREEAASAYREALRLDPRSVEAWHNLGCVLGELGRTGEAVAALEEALRLRPDHPSARRNLELFRGRSPARPD